MQPKETFTIKELAELFEISRQAMSKHVNKLDPSFLAKNERGYKIVLSSGVLQIARNLGNQRLLKKLQEYESYSDKNINFTSNKEVATELLNQLREENSFLREQLSLKEKNSQQLQKLLNQQQQLTLQANQQIDKLQEQLQLTYTEKTSENESTSDTAEDDKTPIREKKWWQFWQ
ncbi:helix-turn-helix transcriptional regulator [Enterococcus faecium]|nr:helix-turn-helix transcriptional regulator [Enterococcus faecium]EME3582263.1 helix-turn-helix transcriptional regulator [Enterococcus faecium]